MSKWRFVCLSLMLLGLAVGCTRKHEDRIRDSLDAAGLKTWAAGVVAQTKGNNATIGIEDPIFRQLPRSLREIPTDGGVGPTAIRVDGDRVEVLWMYSFGGGFALSISSVGKEQEPNAVWYRVGAGVYYRRVPDGG